MSRSLRPIGAIALALAIPTTGYAQDALPEIDLVQPSSGAMAKWEAGDAEGALALVDAETAACAEQAGGDNAELTVLARCTEMFLIVQQLLFETGDYEGAVAIGDVGIDLTRAAFGENIDLEAFGRLFKGRALGFLFRREAAQEETARALEIARLLYPAGSAELLVFLGAQAEAVAALEDFDAALALYAELWALPVEDSVRAQYGAPYGAILTVAGRADEARAILETSLAALDLGERDPGLATLRLRLAGAYEALGRGEDALALYDQAIAALGGAEGWEAELAEALRGKANALIALQRWTDALALIERARPLHQKVYGSQDRFLAMLDEMEKTVRLASTNERSADTIRAGDEVWAAMAGQRFADADRLLAPRLARCRADAAGGGSIRLCAELVSAMSTAKTGLGLLEQGEKLADEAIAIAEAEYGEESVPMGAALIARMRLYRVQGRPADVVRDGERAIAILEPLPPLYAYAALDLIAAYIEQSQLEPAESLIDRVATIVDRDDVRMQLAINRATLLMARSDYDGAIAILQPIVAARDAGTQAPRYSALLSLAVALRNSYRLDEAMALMEPEIGNFRTIYGDGPSTAMALNVLGEIYATAGRYRDALPLLEEAYTLNLALLGERSPLTGITLINIGYTNLMRGELLTALAQFEKAMEIVSSNGNTNLELMTKILGAIGATVQLLGLTDETVQLARQSLDIAERFYGAETTLALRARLNLASGLADAGSAEDARSEYTKAFELAQKLGGIGRDSMAVAAIGLGDLAASAGDAETARGWYAIGLEMGQSVFAPLDPALVGLIARVGGFELGEAGRLATARSYLRDAGRRTRARIDGYSNFDAAALREVRQFAPIFVKQVEAAWKLSPAR